MNGIGVLVLKAHRKRVNRKGELEADFEAKVTEDSSRPKCGA